MTAALYGAFFFSGCSALIFETLWFHQAGLAFGNSIWASSLVLAGFMAGMAGGNLLATRIGDRLARPLRIYAAVEGLVAISGVLLVVALPAMGAALAPLLRPLSAHLGVLNLVRLTLAFLLLLIPSTAMGLTLPLLTRTLTSQPGRFGAVLGQLYGWNTAGAVAGVAATEFVLVATVGIRGTAFAAAVLSVAVAAVALVFDRRWRAEPPSSTPSSTPSEPAPATAVPSSVPVAAWLLASFGAGFALLALEVIWFRLLLLAVIGYSSTFAVMLGTVLTGIALGGFAAGLALRRWPDAHVYTGPALWVSGGLGVASYAVFLLRMSALSSHLVTEVREVLAVGALLMLPVSLVSGAVFTLAGAGLRASRRSDADAAGTLTFANTLGSALGSLAAGFVLLPLLGMERALFAVIALYALTGATLWAHTATRRSHAIATLVVVAAALAAFPFGSLSARLQRFPIERYASLRTHTTPRAVNVAAVREGVAETLIYLNAPILRDVRTHALFVNATSMADTDWESRRYMKLYVYWPMALHPNLKKSLLIAFGVGNTAKAMTDSPGIERIDVVDISKDVLDNSVVIYPKDTENPLRDPRVHMHVEDGRYFLQTTQERYDLITSEPPPPRSAGVVNLYTREYFQLIHARLAEGGMAAYWLPTHTIAGDVTRSIIRAFCEAFEDCSLWHGETTNLMLVGTRGASGPATLAHVFAQWQDRTVVRELRALGLERPEQLGALFIGDAPFLKRISAGVPALVDDRPGRINDRSLSTEYDEALQREMLDPIACRERFRTSAFIRSLWPPELIEATLPYFEFQGFITGANTQASQSMDAVHRLLTGSILKTPVLWLLGSNGDLQRGVEVATATDLAQPPMQYHLGARLMSERAYYAASAAFGRAEA
ncbi:MAG: fused MFS/spermidine synthase, partial [Alphaproteobacteria bacterium]